MYDTVVQDPAHDPRHWLFALGAQDPEMRAIEDVLRRQGVAYAYAARDGARCHSGNAYCADMLLRPGAHGRAQALVPPPAHHIACVECALPGLAPALARERYDPARDEAAFTDPTEAPPDLPEGAAFAGIPVRYRSLDARLQVKEMLKGGRPAAIEAFMARHAAAGRRVYGNPARGYAGVYL
jgi:hypothetical protein